MCNIRAGDGTGALDSGVVLRSPEVFDQKVPFRMSNNKPCNVDFRALPFGWIFCIDGGEASSRGHLRVAVNGGR